MSIAALEERDARLDLARQLLINARNLVRDTVEWHRPHVTGPAAAVDLHRMAEQLDALAEPAPVGRDNAALVRAAALMCAGEEWGRLSAVLPTLRLRVISVTAALGDTAVQLRRAARPEEEVETVDQELRLIAAKMGADHAYAAADSAFLPSLHDFLE